MNRGHLRSSENSDAVLARAAQVFGGRADVEPSMELVEYWRWRYRDPKTGRVCRTLFQLTEAEARKLPEAERIPGSMLLREVEADDFPDTGPDVHPVIAEPPANL